MRYHLRRSSRRCATIAMALCLGIGGLLVSADLRPAEAAASRPNIVLLVLDDIAPLDDRLWSRLPAIRGRFMNRGIRFQNAFGETPLCCPGRANLLTGLHTHHHGVYRNDATLFDPRVTLATELNGVGYATFIAGKYFNRTDLIADKTPRGWDRSAIMAGGYYDYEAWVDGMHSFQGRAEADYSTDFFAGHGVEFLRSAPPEAPVFAYLTPFAVHGGHDHQGAEIRYQPVPARRHVGDPRCAGIPPWRPPSYNEEDVSDKPAEIAGLDPVEYPDGWPLERICETLLSVDEMVNAMVLELKAQGRLHNTMWVLTSDNGMAFGSHRVPKKSFSYSTPLPLWINWPAGRGTVPRVESHFVSNIDLAPTLCSLAGCTMGPYRDGRPSADGVTFAGLLRDGVTSHRKPEILEQADGITPVWAGLRTTYFSPLGLWHYVEWTSGEKELYDLRRDPHELENVAGNEANASTEEKLSRRLADLLSDPSPTPSPTLTPEPTATPTVAP